MVDAQLRGRDVVDERVLAAMERVPREFFVPQKVRNRAYDDAALPIGDGQTISQPYMVARICEALSLAGAERVLDVGTGSGYQAAVLAELAEEVDTIERIPELAIVRERTSRQPATAVSAFMSATGRVASRSVRPSTRLRLQQRRRSCHGRCTTSSSRAAA